MILFSRVRAMVVLSVLAFGLVTLSGCGGSTVSTKATDKKDSMMKGDKDSMIKGDMTKDKDGMMMKGEKDGMMMKDKGDMMMKDKGDMKGDMKDKGK